MATWQSGDVQVNGIKLHYTRTGGAKQPLVLAHGFSDNGLCWTPVAQALETMYDVIMVNSRGHGGSDAPETGYDTAQLAADLHGVIQALALKQPIVMGHSMGAITTLKLAGTYPDVPHAIILEDPPARWMEDSENRPNNADWLAERRARLTDLKSKTRDELIAQQRAASPNWSDEELGPWADAKLQLSMNVLNREGAEEIDWHAVVRRVTCPALLITADTDRSAIVSPEAADELKKLVPQLQVVHIPRAGHNIRREQFTRYMDVVQGFLAEVGTARA
jgi:pimeloyl-ACP methyl ester carboxylesterase